MMNQRLSDLFSMVRTDMIALQMNRMEARFTRAIHGFKKVYVFPLPLAVITVPIDLASTGVEGGTEIVLSRPHVYSCSMRV
jgi:hypothetical protein